jgi:hypothetical protein
VDSWQIKKFRMWNSADRDASQHPSSSSSGTVVVKDVFNYDMDIDDDDVYEIENNRKCW